MKRLHFFFRKLTAKLCLGVSLLLIPALCSAQYNPAYWAPLNTGVNGTVHSTYALVMHDTTYSSPLYAGGDFTTAEGKPSSHVAVWNNSNSWDSLGSGVNNTVFALCMYNGKLYAGGKFDTAGRIACNSIASWDSVKWDSLGAGVNGNVYALCVYNNALYAGGDFTMANGIKANRIARWDGSQWDSVGAGFDAGTVYALAVFNDTLYAGGSFTSSNGITVNHIARWNGTTWDSVQSGTNNTVYALTPYIGGLYAGGAFTKSGNINTHYISQWDTTHWDSVLSGTNDTVRALNVSTFLFAVSIRNRHSVSSFSFNNVLLVGGNFTMAGGYSCRNIAVYSPWYLSWSNIGGANYPVYSIANTIYNAPTSYIGGAFDSVYNQAIFSWISANYVADFQLTVGSGVPTEINTDETGVYPNPSTGIFNIAISHQPSAISQIEVFNVLGEKVYSKSYQPMANGYQLDLRSQSNGVYFYRVLNEDGGLEGEGKLVIEK